MASAGDAAGEADGVLGLPAWRVVISRGLSGMEMKIDILDLEANCLALFWPAFIECQGQ